jgi:Protein of unknown function (DUF2933)
MSKLHLGHCIIGLALAAAVLIGLGVSASTLGILAIALMCPVMMIVMMRMMMGEHRTHDEDAPTRQTGI